VGSFALSHVGLRVVSINVLLSVLMP
jgi:hypothetical protein